MKYSVLGLICLSLLGCANNSERSHNPINADITEANIPLFAKLENINGHYLFTKFTNKEPNSNNEPWVNLKTGSPAWNISNQRCGKGFIKDRNRDVSDCSIVVDEKLFLESDFDTGDAAARVFGAVFTMGLTLTGVSYDVKFNQSKFNQAYASALSSIQENELFHVATITNKIEHTLDDIKSKYQASYNATRPNLQILDRSGFYANEINFSSLINFHMNQLSEIPRLETSTVKQMGAELTREYDNLTQQWREQSSSVVVKCPESINNQAGYSFSMSCPKLVTLASGKGVADVKILINSKTFYGIYPRTLKANDDKVSIVLSEDKISFTNNTPRFLTVESISFYYGGEIAQLKDLAIELPPNASLSPENKIPLRNFRLKSSALDFKGLTKEQAKRTNLEYGFAVKYRVAGTVTEFTLYSVENYLLAKLLGVQ